MWDGQIKFLYNVERHFYPFLVQDPIQSPLYILEEYFCKFHNEYKLWFWPKLAQLPANKSFTFSQGFLRFVHHSDSFNGEKNRTHFIKIHCITGLKKYKLRFLNSSFIIKLLFKMTVRFISGIISIFTIFDCFVGFSLNYYF